MASRAEELELGRNPLAADCPSGRCTTIRIWLRDIARRRTDSDGDGLTLTERKERGTSSMAKDTDGDSARDWEEPKAGLNPLAEYCQS